MTPLLWVAIAIYYVLMALGFWSVAAAGKEDNPLVLMMAFMLGWVWPIMLPLLGARAMCTFAKAVVKIRRDRKTVHSLFSNNGGGKK